MLCWGLSYAGGRIVMGSGRVAQAVKLTEEQRGQLGSFASYRILPYAQVQRAKIILMAAQGVQNIHIAAQLRTTREMVGKWRQRFVEQGWRACMTSFAPVDHVEWKTNGWPT